MTMFLDCGALRSLRLAFGASLVILLSMILLRAIISKIEGAPGKGIGFADYSKDRFKSFKRTHKHRRGPISVL